MNYVENWQLYIYHQTILGPKQKVRCEKRLKKKIKMDWRHWWNGLECVVLYLDRSIDLASRTWWLSQLKNSWSFFPQREREQWQLRYYPHIPTLLLLSLFLPPSSTTTTSGTSPTRNHGPDRLGTPRDPRGWRCVSPASRTMSYLLLLLCNTTIHLRSSSLQRAWVILWLATILHWVSLLSQFLAYGPSSSALSSPRFLFSSLSPTLFFFFSNFP